MHELVNNTKTCKETFENVQIKIVSWFIHYQYTATVTNFIIQYVAQNDDKHLNEIHGYEKW